MLGLLPTVFDFKTGYDKEVLIYLAKHVEDIPTIEHSEIFITLAEEGEGARRDSILCRSLKKIDRTHTIYASMNKKLGTSKQPFAYSEVKFEGKESMPQGVIHENTVYATSKTTHQSRQTDFDLFVLEDEHSYWLGKAKTEWNYDLNDLLKLSYQAVNGQAEERTDAETKAANEALSVLKRLAEKNKDFATYLQDYLLSTPQLSTEI